MLIIVHCLNVITWPLIDHFAKLEIWVLNTQTLSIIYTIKAVQAVAFSRDRTLMAKVHILYTMSLMGNFAVVTLYWLFIHHVTMDK